MIKSKIDARERALELAVKCFESAGNYSGEQVIYFAELYEQYLIGDAELPEVTDDNAHLKELLEIANKSFDNSRKCNNDKIDCMFKGGNADVPSEIPFKLETELKKKDNI
ncbi:MAG: hypothetical protein IKY94_11675 [Lachnospiraceae bacterium]|nr:hypothetical protein [Lachnospiraceae bacterium]